MPVLEIKNLHKSFGALEVLKGVDLSVTKGEVVSIIGPSGSGKSTLLRCATLLERMDKGSMAYLGDYAVKEGENGESIYASKDELRHLKRHFGLVFQNFNLFPHYSVIKNIVDAPITVQHRNKDEVYEKARELLDKMGLGDRENYYPHQLSGGQQQRVSIARALINDPAVLFFDEPTSALDPELTQEVLKIIRTLADQKTTMVIVTHEMNFAAEVSNKIIFIDQGLIVEQGTPQEVIYSPKIKRTQEFLSHLK